MIEAWSFSATSDNEVSAVKAAGAERWGIAPLHSGSGGRLAVKRGAAITVARQPRYQQLIPGAPGNAKAPACRQWH